MLRLLILTTFLLSSFSFTIAQLQLAATSRSATAFETQKLDNGIGQGKYATYSIDTRNLRTQAIAGAPKLEFTLTVGTETFAIDASRNDNILAPDFTATLYEADDKYDLTSSLNLL